MDNQAPDREELLKAIWANDRETAEKPADPIAKKVGRLEWWTDERVALLKKLWEEGQSAHYIATELGTTRNAVLGKAHRTRFLKHPKATKQCTRPPRPPRRILVRAAPKPSLSKILGDVVPIEDSQIPISQRRSLLELEPGMCRFGVGHPDEVGFFFCAGPVIETLPYCAAHARRCYTPREG